MDRDELKQKLKKATPVTDDRFKWAVDNTVENSRTLNVNEEIVIAIEELSELQKELTKYIRGEKDKIGISEEIADVYIVLNIIKNLFNISQEDVDKIINVKIARHVLSNASKKLK